MLQGLKRLSRHGVWHWPSGSLLFVPPEHMQTSLEKGDGELFCQIKQRYMSVDHCGCLFNNSSWLLFHQPRTEIARCLCTSMAFPEQQKLGRANLQPCLCQHSDTQLQKNWHLVKRDSCALQKILTLGFTIIARCGKSSGTSWLYHCSVNWTSAFRKKNKLNTPKLI